jgi:hypothetical protein
MAIIPYHRKLIFTCMATEFGDDTTHHWELKCISGRYYSIAVCGAALNGLNVYAWNDLGTIPMFLPVVSWLAQHPSSYLGGELASRHCAESGICGMKSWIGVVIALVSEISWNES